MKLTAATLAGCALSALAAAQTPDVFVRADARLHYRTVKDGETTLRWYDSMGRLSTVGLSFRLEPGFHAYVSQKLQRPPTDGDPEQLDEYYIEDPGLWRVGKQYIPFGRQGILNESARGASARTSLLFENLPLTLSVFDNGQGRTRGGAARAEIGQLGLSAAYGDHIGIQSTSLNVVRRPEEAPGLGRGYKTALGADFARTSGPYLFEVEVVAFRQPNSALDRPTEVSDAKVSFGDTPFRRLTLGWSRDWGMRDDFFRLEGSFRLTESGFYLEPIVRLKGGEVYDVGISVRFKT